MPVLEYYHELQKVAEINSSPGVDEVYKNSANIVRELLAGELSGNVTV